MVGSPHAFLPNDPAYRDTAGVSLEKAAGSRTSVHIGSFTHDWNYILTRDPLMDVKYKATGVEFSLLANRLSWFYDLVGPSISLDTACSSSLMALHLACQSLRTHESNMVSIMQFRCIYRIANIM